MTYVIGSRTPIRVLLALMALSIGLIAAIVPSAPARAGDSFPAGGLLLRSGNGVCVENYDEFGRPYVKCFELPVWVHRIPIKPDPPCGVCAGLGFEFVTGFPEERQLEVVGSLAAGFDLLVEADLATDPRQVEQLRAKALERFTAAAVGASDPDGDPVMPVTGYLHLDSGTFERAEVPSLAAAGARIVDGLRALDPDPDPMLGQKLFDAAYDLLTDARYR